jgi:hypothetical protein
VVDAHLPGSLVAVPGRAQDDRKSLRRLGAYPLRKNDTDPPAFSAEPLEKARTAGLEATRPQPSARRSEGGLDRFGRIDRIDFGVVGRMSLA